MCVLLLLLEGVLHIKPYPDPVVNAGIPDISEENSVSAKSSYHISLLEGGGDVLKSVTVRGQRVLFVITTVLTPPVSYPTAITAPCYSPTMACAHITFLGSGLPLMLPFSVNWYHDKVWLDHLAVVLDSEWGAHASHMMVVMLHISLSPSLCPWTWLLLVA